MNEDRKDEVPDDDPRRYRRNTDPETSHESAKHLRNYGSWLLIVSLLVAEDRPEGWTAYEIDQRLPGRLGRCPWHRVGDVRDRGWATWIETESGGILSRPGPTLRHQGASRITPEGIAWFESQVPDVA